MARPSKLHPVAIAAMSRAYIAGARPSELAREYEVSAAYVINKARDFLRDLQVRKLKSQLVRAKESVSPSPEPHQESPFLKRKVMRLDRSGNEQVMTIKLPRVSIQEGR